ncbi:MAG: VWA domain-containing protein [Flectobacillus sp.]|nr:VWA domain-containing protein [Flectobacillus sp.]
MENDWFSTYWIKYQTLMSFDWASPYYLYCLPIVPLLFLLRNWLIGAGTQKLNVSFSASDLGSNWVSYLRFVPGILMVFSIMLVFLALARPQRYITEAEDVSEGIDIMLAVDISESMESKDIPPSRLVAAKKVAKKFIEGRHYDRIGLVVFSGEPFSLCPLTTDYEVLNEYIDDMSPEMIKTSGTAVGNALGMCINRMREVASKSKVAILISDGDNTAGNLDPVTAAKLAKAFGIKVYTIVVGTDQKAGEKVDETSLRKIANISEGVFFRATDEKSLAAIFKSIDRLEKVKIKQNRFRNVQDFYQNYLRLAILLLLISFAAKNTFLGNILED